MRILIIDDHPLFCDGLRLLLETLGVGTEIVACHTAGDALPLIEDGAWDLLLLDWNLGVHAVGGAGLIQRIKTVAPAARIVVVSAEASTLSVRNAVDAGAVGFVPKQASAELLIDAIRITSQGGIYLPDSVLETPSADWGGGMLQARYPGLTARQAGVLVCMVQGQSNKQIARALGISEGTVKQHLNAAYRELAVGSRTEAVYLLAQQGIRVF